MKKSDLKTGMVVQMRNDKNYCVFLNTNNGDFLAGPGGWNPLDRYNEDFTNKSNYPILDIVKVYNADESSLVGEHINNIHGSKLLWEKGQFEFKAEEEIVKMTLEEIEEALGHKVEIHTGIPSGLEPPEPFPSWRIKSPAF